MDMAKNTVHRINRNLARRLREARQESGLSTRAVVAKLPRRVAVSHVMIAAYEKGGTVPSIEVLAALATVYQRTLNWFLEERETLSGFRYRNLKSRVNVGDKRRFEAVADRWIDAFVRLERHLGEDPPTGRLAGLCPGDDVPPKVLAAEVRKRMTIPPNAPITNTVELLREAGVRSIEVATPLGIDAVAARRGEDFVVVLNPETSNDRLRLTACHELAHVLYDDCKDEGRLTDEAVEERAYEFASELLLPEPLLQEAFRGQSFLKLIAYKERYGISVAAMIFRAERARFIKTTLSRRLWVEMSKRGWRKNEPGNVWRDRAIDFETMLDSAVQTRRLTWPEAERVTGLKAAELKERVEAAFGPDWDGHGDSDPEDEGGAEDRVLKFPA